MLLLQCFAFLQNKQDFRVCADKMNALDDTSQAERRGGKTMALID